MKDELGIRNYETSGRGSRLYYPGGTAELRRVGRYDGGGNAADGHTAPSPMHMAHSAAKVPTNANATTNSNGRAHTYTGANDGLS